MITIVLSIILGFIFGVPQSLPIVGFVVFIVFPVVSNILWWIGITIYSLTSENPSLETYLSETHIAFKVIGFPISLTLYFLTDNDELYLPDSNFIVFGIGGVVASYKALRSILRFLDWVCAIILIAGFAVARKTVSWTEGADVLVSNLWAISQAISGQLDPAKLTEAEAQHAQQIADFQTYIQEMNFHISQIESDNTRLKNNLSRTQKMWHYMVEFNLTASEVESQFGFGSSAPRGVANHHRSNRYRTYANQSGSYGGNGYNGNGNGNGHQVQLPPSTAPSPFQGRIPQREQTNYGGFPMPDYPTQQSNGHNGASHGDFFIEPPSSNDRYYAEQEELLASGYYDQ